MRRFIGGAALIIHGLAHAGLGVWAGSFGALWLVTPLWAAAIVGFLVAGFGVMGVRPFAAWWAHAAAGATFGSLALLILFSHPVFLIGLVADIVILSILIRRALPGARQAASLNAPRHPALARVGTILAIAIIVYAGIAALARPVFIQWGTTAEDRALPLLGDSAVPDARYRLDHAITIRAPADSIWPWLVQIGQDRAGFYSYSWLERLVGDEIRNADRIHPEWQRLAVGDFVRAVQPDYAGGALGDSLGWRVTAVEPGRAMILENWGTFALVPIDSTTTRFIIRTRGAGEPGLASILFGPIEVFGFEPAHFIMQRGMMRGIRDRAEGRGG
jgi:hypothetical protein